MNDASFRPLLWGVIAAMTCAIIHALAAGHVPMPDNIFFRTTLGAAAGGFFWGWLICVLMGLKPRRN